jgi:hypothetical protein
LALEVLGIWESLKGKVGQEEGGNRKVMQNSVGKAWEVAPTPTLGSKGRTHGREGTLKILRIQRFLILFSLSKMFLLF